MTTKTNELVEEWRARGPVTWAEGPYGWTGIDGKPITLAPWQRAVLQAWWENKETVTTLAVSNVKKTGKTFVDAVLLAWRWLALPGEHFAVGNDLDQSAGRQFQQVSEMTKRNGYLRRNVRATNKQLVFEPTGSTITALALDAAGNAGANHLTASHTEAWGIIYEAGIRAFEELTPPPGRFFGLPALRIADSYAGFEAESTTWHGLVDRGLKGESISAEWPIFKVGGLMLFHMDGVEAQERCYPGSPEEAAAYYADQRATLRPGTFSRLHENRRASGAESFIDMDQWDACIDPNHRPGLSGEALFVGVDAAIKHDSAAVVAVSFDYESKRVVLVKHRIWQPSTYEPLNIDSTIGAFLRELSRAHSLRSVRYDPYQLVDLSQRLQVEGIPMQEYPQTTANLTAMGQNLYELIQAHNIKLYPAPDLRMQASHAIAVQGSRGWKIAKEKSAFKVDSIVAMAMAALAAVENPITWWIT